MRFNLLQQENHNVLPEYGKRRLLLYADTLQGVAGSFDESAIKDLTVEGIQKYLVRTKKEQNLLWANQLSETADALKALANETFATSNMLERMKRRIEKGIKNNRLVLEDLYVVEAGEHLEIGMRVRALEDEMFYTDELMDYLSDICHRRLRQHESNPSYVHDEYKLLIFEEEVNYFILEGIASAKKEGEKESGDSYLLKEFSRGIYLAAISDGMGSGEEAAKDSELLLETLEKFMETGFHVDKVGSLLNSMMYLHGKEDHTVTLDTCEIDLYQGTCRFLKYGAVGSYIKRGDRIWKINGESLPLGVFSKGEPDESAYGLEDGDYIIMMTDGVTDAFCAVEDPGVIRDFLSGLSFENPRQLASLIMQEAIVESGGHISDDMTVVVFGIFENR